MSDKSLIGCDACSGLLVRGILNCHSPGVSIADSWQCRQSCLSDSEHVILQGPTTHAEMSRMWTVVILPLSVTTKLRKVESIFNLMDKGNQCTLES
jgi:hypothetical protein